MKRLLLLGFVLGLAGTLATAYFAPWVEYQRYRSPAEVVPNVGRVEQFVVRLPTDRIGAPIEDLPAARLEHFKLRDADGNVIGVAARHQTTLTGGDETAWLLAIPSRGTLTLASAASASGTTIESRVAARGLTAGDNAEPELSIDFGAPARSVSATGEFSGIDFQLVETWVVTGIEDNGQIRGTLHLNTTGRRSS
jgi:hypothetical protein